MRILITGATGFVGRHLVPELLKQNHEIYEITVQPEISKSLFGHNIKSFSYNSNHKDMVNFVKNSNPEILIHLAAYLTSSDEYEQGVKLLDANIRFLFEVLDCSKYISLKLFIYTGTFAEYFSNDSNFDPAYLYAATKTAGRYLVKYYAEAYSFKVINVVPYSIYGGQDSQKKIIDLLIDSIGSEKPINLTAGEQRLDFIHIEDVVSAYCEIIKSEKYILNGETFFVGTGKATSIKDLAFSIERAHNKKTNINWGAIPYRKRDIMVASCKLELNNQKINWKPSKLQSI